MKTKLFIGLFILTIIGAVLFRVVQLDLRPMHHDEANQAVKFGYLLENGDYSYDKTDHHGPSLYYLTLPFAWLSSGTSFAALSETTLRLVTVRFGLGFILLLFLLKNDLGREASLFAGIFAAVSPVMVYYNRFFIQESLLVFFVWGGLIFAWRYFQKPSALWAVLTGLFAGMAYTTKETSILAFAAAICAVFLVRILRISSFLEKKKLSLMAKHIILGIGAAFLISFLFYSSFFSNLKGLLDSFLSFQSYFIKAGAEGIHSHPWNYYLSLLAFSRNGSGPFWSEALVLILALIGASAAMLSMTIEKRHKIFVSFITFYTIILTVFYSLISYKTPWNCLPFYTGMVILAGYGTAFLLRRAKKPLAKIIFVLVIMAGTYHLGYQSYRANFIYPADSRNPYVYAHTSTDFMNLIQRIDDLALLHPDNQHMLIVVVSDPSETWPLPWYLRSYTQVGYWTDALDAGIPEDAPVFITSLDNADILSRRFLAGYQTEYYGLRPEVLLAVHIKKDLWDLFLKHRAGH